MSERNYWLDLFTYVSWNEFLDAGGTISGFSENRWKHLQKVNIGDYLLCYITGISRFIGILEVTSKPYKDETEIWKDQIFPSRFKVKVVSKLSVETAVPVFQLRGKISAFENLKSPHAWTGHFRGSPSKWKKRDGLAVVEAIEEAIKNPVKRPVDKKKLKYRPKAVRAKMGLVTIPEDDEIEDETPEDTKSKLTHTEIQWRLLKLGSDMGLDVWVARNDKNREYNNNSLSSINRIIDEIPLQFDDATNKTIELIDVLWLKGNTIVAAFEIESTTSIYSGLLRMADLISMQPNLNIPLYLVAPDDRREKVIKEINRPTFSRLSQPMFEICNFISFSTLIENIEKTKEFVNRLNPDFIQDFSESCILDDM